MARMRAQLFGPAFLAVLRPHLPAHVERALDMGCGEGAFTRVLAQELGPGASVSGIDLDPAMVRAACAAGGAEFRQGDAAALPHPAASFDLVTTHTALAVMREPRAAVLEALRVLRPGGVLLAVERPGGRGNWPALETPASPRFPQAAELDALRRALNDSRREAGSAQTVADLPGLFFRSGFVDIAVEGAATAVWSGAAGAAAVRARHAAELEAIAAAGGTERLRALCAAYTEFLLAEDHLWAAGEVEWKPRLIVRAVRPPGPSRGQGPGTGGGAAAAPGARGSGALRPGPRRAPGREGAVPGDSPAGDRAPGARGSCEQRMGEG